MAERTRQWAIPRLPQLEFSQGGAKTSTNDLQALDDAMVVRNVTTAPLTLVHGKTIDYGGRRWLGHVDVTTDPGGAEVVMPSGSLGRAMLG
jgi:hypothetical protein